MAESIEDARALLGEHIAVLQYHRGDDPGYRNVLGDRVRLAADAYALAVLEECAEVAMSPTSKHRIMGLRAPIEGLGRGEEQANA